VATDSRSLSKKRDDRRGTSSNEPTPHRLKADSRTAFGSPAISLSMTPPQHLLAPLPPAIAKARRSRAGIQVRDCGEGRKRAGKDVTEKEGSESLATGRRLSFAIHSSRTPQHTRTVQIRSMRRLRLAIRDPSAEQKVDLLPSARRDRGTRPRNATEERDRGTRRGLCSLRGKIPRPAENGPESRRARKILGSLLSRI
jgi:hypothetical protein